ncbi:MlaA family lipoprotein [Aromatoleum diolicum]|uniref:VacJ family lipoprotein n=1 Tax=Aromatoleum diolicum TaxID=75796 RepID=A0ABX1Q611_9RHOO|nr:VacJ family lipoprotein [Aromatoleum diolicum]NMG73743.1 VacJ family lipoprotein [Aromatoleum diolicum]
MKRKFPQIHAAVVAVALGALVLSGCATRAANPDDPLETYNRAMFGFNETVDQAVIRPVAEAYDAATPLPVRTGIGNFFGNLGDLWIGGNNLLQGKLGDGLSDLLRFGLNSTVGILGFFDVASELELPKHDEDFGQTLGRWGVGEGAYFVVPFFGPRTLRDAVVLPVDMYGDNVWGIGDVPTRNVMTALRLVHARANLLGIDKTLDEGTLDKYSYARDFYLQQRRYKVFDGNPPLEDIEFNGAALPPGYATDIAAQTAVNQLQLVSVGAGDFGVAAASSR